MRSAQVGDSESQGRETGNEQATPEQLQVLFEAMAKYREELLRDARLYVYKFGLDGDITSIAEDVLQEALLTAIRIAARFDTSRPARPWLRTIVMNQARTTVRNRRNELKYIEPVTGAARRAVTQETDPSELSEAELFGLLGATTDGADQGVEDGLEELLAMVGESDREVLRLAFVEGFQGADLAAQLGVSKGAAYTRKCRAIDRLRAAHKCSSSGQEGP